MYDSKGLRAVGIVNGRILTDGDGKPEPTEREKAIKASMRPVGQTTPRVFMCGSCLAVQVKRGHICPACDTKLATREAMGNGRPMADIVAASIVGVLLLAVWLWASGK